MSGRLGALLCLAACATAPVVVAQPAPSAEASPAGVELRYEAFEGCPERDAFAKNLDARRRGAVSRGAVQLEVRLQRLEPERVAGSVTVKSGSGAASARRITASTCNEAADALALIAALALQGIEVEEVPSSGAPSDERADRPRGRRADRPRASEPSRTDDVPSPEPSEEEVVAPAELAPDEPKPAPEPAPQLERATKRQGTDHSAGDDVEDDTSSGPDPRTTRFYALLSGGVASGVLPALQPLPELALGVEHSAPRVLAWSAEAAFRLSPDQTRHFADGVVAFGWWTGRMAACLGARGTQLSASGCAALELGILSGGASDTDNPRDERRPWVAAGPGLMLGYDITRALRLQLRAELLTPLARYRLELPAGTAVHEPADLGVRAGLGVGLALQ